MTMDNFVEVLNYITYIATEEQMIRIKEHVQKNS